MSSLNPFEVLRLDPQASEEEIVQQAGRLRQRASDEAELTALRQAVQALTGTADERLLHGLLTFPQPRHQWPALERLAQAYRRPPAVVQTPPPPCPPLDLEAVAEMFRPLLRRELEEPPQPLPLPAFADSPEEVRRQTLAGLWQLLLAEPEALARQPLSNLQEPRASERAH